MFIWPAAVSVQASLTCLKIHTRWRSENPRNLSVSPSPTHLNPLLTPANWAIFSLQFSPLPPSFLVACRCRRTTCSSHISDVWGPTQMVSDVFPHSCIALCAWCVYEESGDWRYHTTLYSSVRIDSQWRFLFHFLELNTWEQSRSYVKTLCPFRPGVRGLFHGLQVFLFLLLVCSFFFLDQKYNTLKV